MSAVALKQTILNRAHIDAGAKLVDFGGWEMPVNYGSQIEEHLNTRSACGLFDVSHMAVVDITGNDSKSFLQKVVANDVAKLKTNGQALYGCLLNEAACVIDDLIVYRTDPGYRIVINAGTAENDLNWLNEQATAFDDLLLTPRRADLKNSKNSLGMIAVQGPSANGVLSKAIPESVALIDSLKPFHSGSVQTKFGEIMIARTGYTGEDGFELVIPEDQTESVWNAVITAGGKPAGLGARDTLRLEAGMNLYGQDMNDQTNPLDAGLGWTIDLSTDRNFIGRTALEKYQQQFSFLGLVLLDKGVLRGHQVVETNLGRGEITSGTFSPSLQQSIALAKLPKGIELGSTVTVLIRDKALQAKVVKPCFVRKGQSLI
jgi:aminomethyltransferase